VARLSAWPLTARGRRIGVNVQMTYQPSPDIARGEWAISGSRAADLRAHLPDFTPSRSSHLLKPPHLHGLIKKVGHRYKYYLTKLGRRVVATTLAMREFVLVPSLCNA